MQIRSAENLKPCHVMENRSGLLRPAFLWMYAAAGLMFFVVLSGMFSLVAFPGPPDNPPLPPLTYFLKEFGVLIGIACSLTHVWMVYCAKKLPMDKKIEMILMTTSIIFMFSAVYVIGVLSFFLSPLPFER